MWYYRTKGQGITAKGPPKGKAKSPAKAKPRAALAVAGAMTLAPKKPGSPKASPTQLRFAPVCRPLLLLEPLICRLLGLGPVDDSIQARRKRSQPLAQTGLPNRVDVHRDDAQLEMKKAARIRGWSTGCDGGRPDNSDACFCGFSFSHLRQ